MSIRQYSFLDHCLDEIQHFMKYVMSSSISPEITSPAMNFDEPTLNAKDLKHITGLMRVDHTGEICAQALYRGQALVARSTKTKTHLYHAAEEEHNHLAWCEERLKELGAKTSILNSVWYTKSFILGTIMGSISDVASYSFVIETENQVIKHLESHLHQIPAHDKKSRAILMQMHKDEQSHADKAKLAGGTNLPFFVKTTMKMQSKIMTTMSYWI